ncbi:CapA family protein [Pseudonocardia zijingensis]|uniref:Capsule synthesis protein CapA domain-containing protein n=1 Tax=Pseudonocardia zijingensis TaxID=153376 RepID=A0ABN1Q0B6_9PSEU
MPSARLMVVGDLILEEPEPGACFAPSAGLLRTADLLVGNVEVPHTTRGEPQRTAVPALPAAPAHLAALRDAGFHVGTLAANHVYDLGEEGVADTRDGLLAHGVRPVGAGATLAEAREPAVLTTAGVRWGVLAYNCVGPELSWASPTKGGCAHIRMLTADGRIHDVRVAGHDDAAAAVAAAGAARPHPEDLAALRTDVEALRDRVDVLVVAFHKGMVHTPAVVLEYERTVAHAAIDAGADVVVGHHAHILRGIEVHRGRPIFHGLGNWVTVTRALDVADNDDPGRLAWSRRRRELFGFDPDPAMPTYPFHPESRHTMIGTVDLHEDGSLRAGFVPCWIDDAARPVPCSPTGDGRATADYVRDISARAGFSTTFTPDESEVTVHL